MPEWKSPESFFTADCPPMMIFSVMLDCSPANLMSTSPRFRTVSAFLASRTPSGPLAAAGFCSAGWETASWNACSSRVVCFCAGGARVALTGSFSARGCSGASPSSTWKRSSVGAVALNDFGSGSGPAGGREPWCVRTSPLATPSFTTPGTVA